jgi:uncharacterized phiE125 gp8 family phage protein
MIFIFRVITPIFLCVIRVYSVRMKNENILYSLVPPADFRAIAGIDDREAALCAFVLVTATHAIEHHCARRLLLKKHTGYADCYADDVSILREYPVRKIHAVYNDTHHLFGPETLIAPEAYYTLPEAGKDEDIPFFLAFRTDRLRYGEKVLKVRYTAGYGMRDVPADLKAACLELAAWNMSRYRGKRIGLTGSVRGRAGEGEHLEMGMPENVKQLLEPYRRKTI